MELSERCIKTLEKEGFLHIFEWHDSEGTVYEEHTHQDKVTIFVTEGSLHLFIGSEKVLLKAGDRYNIPPLTPHYGVVGPEGCQLVIGEMIEGDS